MSKGSNKVKRARANYQRVKRTAKPGSGKLFKAVTKEIRAEGKSKKQAKAIAAGIGRKKYGVKGMAKLSAKGRGRRK